MASSGDAQTGEGSLHDANAVEGVDVDLPRALEAERQRRIYAEDLYLAANSNSLQGQLVLEDGRVVHANQRVLDLLGYSLEELKALTPETMADLVHPDDRARTLGRGGWLRELTYARGSELRLICRDGRVLWGEILATGIRFLGKHAIQVTLLDITRRKESELAHQRTLQDLERRIQERTAELAETNIALEQELLRSARARRAIRSRNHELRTLYAITSAFNASRDLQGLLSTVLEHTVNALHVDVGWITVVASAGGQQLPYDAYIQPGGGEPYVSDARAEALSRATMAYGSEDVLIQTLNSGPQQDGGWPEPSQAAGVALRSPTGPSGALLVICSRNRIPRVFTRRDRQLLSAIGVQLSISLQNARLAREAAEVAALREMSRVRSELLAGYSHNLRSPLGLITVATTTLLRDDVDFDRATQREFLEEIRAQAAALSGTVDAMLDLERLESGYVALRREPTDVEELVHQIVESCDGPMAQHSLRVLAPDALIMAELDVRRMGDVLRNMIDNAKKYSPSGTEIIVSVEQVGDAVAIKVTDKGIGIPLEEQPRIFERFYRVQNPTTRRVYGTGLGLPLCKTIVEAHGGRILVDSDLGKGSTFTVIVPTHA